ncbi:MAG TPA: hypothetical protein VJA26_13665 [Gammaproteobacteria bacterium]|nr:hypothetical protein [Gammaproteobacteria bacterium]
MTIKEKLRSLGQRRSVSYVLSIPERAVRSASALTAGLVREVADVALPIGLRRGRLYQNLVGTTLRFLIEHVGQVNGVYAADEQLSRDFLLRRSAGNGIEMMGVLLFRASPVWVLAALADVCGFGRQLIPEITEALKKEGLLDSEDSFSTMEQLLQGLERSAAQLAESVNTPPLDVAGLRQEWAKLVTEVRELPAPKLPSRSTVTQLWSDLRDEAAVQNRSVFELSSLMAVSAVGNLPARARVLSKSAALAIGKGGAVLSDALLDHYRSTLRQIHEVGFVNYGTRQLTPYVRAALAVFSPEHETLTGKLVKKL